MNNSFPDIFATKRACIVFAALFAIIEAGFGAVIPADRQVDWYQTGVPGGIPNVTTVYTTLSPGATAAQINSAISSCPSNAVVLLNAGTYNLGGARIECDKDGVVLRGATNAAGFPTTILNNTDVQLTRSQWPSAGGWGNVRPIGISSGLTEGSTSITLAAPPNTDFKVGDVFMIDQLADGTLVKSANMTWAYRNSRPYCVVVQCTSISGNTIGFQPPLIGEYWSTARSPEAFGWSSLYGPTLKRAGLENVEVIPNGSLYNITMGPAWGCWAKNIRTSGWPTAGGSAGLRMTYSANCSVFWSIFRDVGQVSNSSYAIYPVVVTGCAVEGNIFTNLALAMPCISVSGCSFSYNFGTGPYPYSPSGWLAEYFFPHGGHSHDTLYEGNWLEGPIYIDAIFGGNNSRMAIVRNRIKGWASSKSGNTTPITLEADTDNTVIIGNVLGENSYHSSYSQMYGVAASCVGTVRLNNYNTVNDGVPATEALIAGDTVANSYRYANKPAWFGSLPWPSFALAASSVANLAYTNLPAGYRNHFGANPPSGPVNLPPVALASAVPTAGVAPLVVAFSSVGSVDPEGATLTRNWTFGDGTPNSTAPNPSHTYQAEGTYVARLTVSDGTNSTTSSDLTIQVGNLPPVVVANANPTAGFAPLAVAFSSAGSLDPEGASLTYSWTFGDGATSTAANPSHTYLAVGAYVARLTVSDGVKTATLSNLVISVADAASTLVASYGFEEGSGALAIDSSGKGNSGAINGATWTTTGRFGRALAFGPGALVTVNDSATLDLTASMTLEAWVYPTALNGSWMNLIFKSNGDPSSANPSYVLQGSTPTAQVPSVYISSAASNLSAPSPLPVNTWSHVATTYDGSMMRLFVNGVQVASRAQTGTIAASSDPLTIGGNTFSGQNWTGQIDEVRVYNRALSAAEIQADMNLAIGGQPTAPQNLRVVGQ